MSTPARKTWCKSCKSCGADLVEEGEVRFIVCRTSSCVGYNTRVPIPFAAKPKPTAAAPPPPVVRSASPSSAAIHNEADEMDVLVEDGMQDDDGTVKDGEAKERSDDVKAKNKKTKGKGQDGGGKPKSNGKTGGDTTGLEMESAQVARLCELRIEYEPKMKLAGTQDAKRQSRDIYKRVAAVLNEEFDKKVTFEQVYHKWRGIEAQARAYYDEVNKTGGGQVRLPAVLRAAGCARLMDTYFKHRPDINEDGELAVSGDPGSLKKADGREKRAAEGDNDDGATAQKKQRRGKVAAMAEMRSEFREFSSSILKHLAGTAAAPAVAAAEPAPAAFAAPAPVHVPPFVQCMQLLRPLLSAQHFGQVASVLRQDPDQVQLLLSLQDDADSPFRQSLVDAMLHS